MGYKKRGNALEQKIISSYVHHKMREILWRVSAVLSFVMVKSTGNLMHCFDKALA